MTGPVPPDVESDGEEGDFGPPDPHDVDDEDLEGDGCCAAGPSGTRSTDPLEHFIQELEDLSSIWTVLTFRLRWRICQCRRGGI